MTLEDSNNREPTRHKHRIEDVFDERGMKQCVMLEIANTLLSLVAPGYCSLMTYLDAKKHPERKIPTGDMSLAVGADILKTTLWGYVAYSYLIN